MPKNFYPEMGLSKSSRHKRTKTGASKSLFCKKRKFNMARQPSNTKIGEERLQRLRCRGGNTKIRALRLNAGNFTCKTHGFTHKTKIIQVMYHPSSNELMRTNTLTMGAVVRLDPQKFKEKLNEILGKNAGLRDVDPVFFSNLDAGRLYGVVSSRPGQCGRADGYILQGEELGFYMKKFKKRTK